MTEARIAFVGAGSTVFTKRLTGDILLTPELQRSELVLRDMERLCYDALRRLGAFVTESIATGSSPHTSGGSHRSSPHACAPTSTSNSSSWPRSSRGAATTSSARTAN